MENIDLIDGYLQNRLSREERAKFESLLDNDADFAMEFQKIKEIQDGIKAHSRIELKQFLINIESELENQESTLNVNNMKKMMTAAVSLVLVAAISFFALKQDQSLSLEEIYANNFSHYDNLNGQVRGESSNINSLENAAYSAYEMGNFATSAAYFATLVETEKTAANYFYMGLANIESGNYAEAINNLNTTIHNFSAFEKQAKWYMAMANLANGDEEAAVTTLVGLTLENSVYKEKAEAIIKELGLTMSTLDYGSTGSVEKRPWEDAPNGSFEQGKRWQIGTVISATNGYTYRFRTDYVMDELVEGAQVEMLVLRSHKKKKSGFAVILGVL